MVAVEVEQRGNLRIVKMAGQASTQSFSMAFLPAIAKAIDEGLNDRSTKAMVPVSYTHLRAHETG